MKAIIDKIEHLLCVASDAGKAEAAGDTATTERLDIELKRGVEAIEQVLGPAEATVEICDRMWWPAIGGEHGRFRAFKEKPADKHSPWYLVMPGGDSVPLNHCADDAIDEAHCRWMVDALNRALGVMASQAPSDNQLRDLLLAMLFDFGRFDSDEERLAEFRRLRRKARAYLASTPTPSGGNAGVLGRVEPDQKGGA